ncbi:MAG: hypothetical protein WC222_04055 [Parachlamydiales bacterium]|jgi:hypothetical protein
MTTDLNTSAGGSQYNPDDSFQFNPSTDVDNTGTVQAPAAPPSGPAAPQGPVDTLEQSDAVAEGSSPEAAAPKLDQPEVQQAILSSSDALKFALMSNFMNIFSSGNNQNIQMDESSLHKASGMYDFSNLQAMDMDFNKAINDIISDSWKKFNEVNKELAQRDQDYLKSNTKAYLDYIGSAQYDAKKQAIEDSDSDIYKKNQGLAQFEAFYLSLPPNAKQDLVTSVQNNKDIPDTVTNNLLSSNLAVFGNAYQEATKDDLQANNAQFVVTAAMLNAGAILAHPVNLDNISSDQISTKLLSDQVVNANSNTTNNAMPVVGFDANTLTAVAYLSAIMVTSPLILSAFQNVAAAKAEGKPAEEAKDVDFAKKYAQNISSFVNSKGFEAAVIAVITQRSGESGQADNDQKQDVVSRLRVIMLATALVLLNKAFSEGIGGKEVREHIEHPETLIDPTSNKAKNPVIGDIEYSLARDINSYLPKDASAREKLLSDIEIYFDSSPSKEELVENNTAIKGAFTEFTPNGSTEVQG